MHKLGSEENSSKFIEDVKVTILASGQGMKITLLDQDDNEIRKESLSSGEKQIYISCLIKAILNESIQILPIFIDTPLGRLDEEHRDNITRKYYPALSEQVVLFSTNSEITPKRYKDISENISKSYLLFNDGANTSLKTDTLIRQAMIRFKIDTESTELLDRITNIYNFKRDTITGRIALSLSIEKVVFFTKMKTVYLKTEENTRQQVTFLED